MKSSQVNFDEFETILKKRKEETIRQKIIIIEYISIFLTIISCLISGYLAYEDYSMAALAVSVDSLLDILVHITVIWRYCNLESNRRDFFASILLSILFYISSFCIEF